MQSLLKTVQAILIVLVVVSQICPIRELLAQANPASVHGSVKSPLGAPVSNTSVVATQLSTGQSLTATSNERGEFEFSELPPGDYEFRVSHSGFESQREPGVHVPSGESVILNFVLQGSSAASSSGGSHRISESQLVGLPLNGRSYNQLATLQAGVADTAGEQASRGVGGGSLTVSGGRSSSNNFLLDGTNIMDTGNRVPRSAAGVQLGSDAVYQVQVLGGNFGAEYGRGSGAVINSITRSGTNEFHGAVFEYFRNSKLDASNFRDPGEPPPFKRNQFGFILTGPVRSETTYFMASYEAMRDRLSTTDVSFFPDAQAREGIITDASGTELRRIEVDPRVAPYLALYPVPNSGSVGGGIGRNTASVFQPTDENYWTVRLDRKISDRDSFFARYTFDDATGTNAQSMYLFRSLVNTRQQYLTLVGTHIFNVSTLTAFRFGYTRPVNAIDTLSSIEIPRSLYFVPDAPQFGQIELPGITTFGPTWTTPERNIMNSFQIAEDVVAQRGPHALKFGFEIHRYRWDVVNGFSKGAVWTFNSLENFLRAGEEGTALSVALPGSDNQKGFRQTLAGLYLQDSYQLNSRVLLSLGLRYELASVVKEKDNRLVFLADPVHDSAFQIGDMLNDNPSVLNFSPRVGITWSPERSGSTVLSTGLGIYYDPLLEYVADLQKSTAPFYKRAVIPNFDSSDTFPDAQAAALQTSLGTRFQVEVLDYHHMKTPRVLRYHLTLQREFWGGVGLQASYVGARGNHLFRGYEANLYPPSITLADGRLCFPGDQDKVKPTDSPGCAVVTSERAGPINPAFGYIGVVSTDGQSFYNALQLAASKSLGSGASLRANYTYSKSVDDTSTYSSGGSSSFSRQYPLMRTLDRGLSDFDIRHRLVVSYFYSPPFGAGQRWLQSGIVSHVLGGWRLGSILSYRSGTPFLPRINVRDNAYLLTANRPNLKPGFSNNPTRGVTSGCTGVPAGQQLGDPDRYFDPCAFSVPDLGTLGNVGRNTLIGPNVFGMDVSLQKELLLGPEKRLQFRAEFFNLPNHPNFASPDGGSTVVSSGVFPGRSNPTAGTQLRTATTSRQIQFALRLSF